MHVARETTEQAAAFVESQFMAEIGAERKEDGTDVTAADREAETMVRDAIRGAYPDDAIIGEEHEHEEGTSGITWFIDPIDGTTNFINGIPLFGVSVAYADEQGPLGAVIALPMLGALYHAERGKGAFRDDVRITISGTWDAERPVMTFSVADRDDERIAGLFAHRPRPRVRVFGSAVAALALFAEGGMQGVFMLDMKPWDYAAGLLIAREAGAAVRPLDMKPPKLPHVASFYMAAEQHMDQFGALLDQAIS